MANLLINIRGTNGSGKSTVPIQMIERDEHAEVITVEKGVMYTICPRYKVLIGGVYVEGTKCGGMDKIRTTDQAKACITAMIRQAKLLKFDVLFEGIVMSTVRSTWIDFLKPYLDDPKITPVVVIYKPPVDVCLSRVYQRNGGKEIQVGAVKDKYNCMLRQIPFWQEAGIPLVQVDNSKVAYEKMLPAFLNARERWRKKYV